MEKMITTRQKSFYKLFLILQLNLSKPTSKKINYFYC